MSADIELVRALEERTFNAWPALQTILVDGWLLRMALGHTKRANAASALDARGEMHPGDFVALVAETYSRHKIEPMVRITPLAPKAYELAFRKAGWTEFDPTHVMLKPLDAAVKPQAPVGVTLVSEPAPTAEWVAGAARAYEFAEWQRDALSQIVGNIRVPAAFVTLKQQREAVGYGIGVAERGLVGLYDLAIDPHARGQGIGRFLVDSLMAWGQEQGAHTAYLQVRVANLKARALYSRLGFTDCYAYFCLRPPR